MPSWFSYIQPRELLCGAVSDFPLLLAQNPTIFEVHGKLGVLSEMRVVRYHQDGHTFMIQAFEEDEDLHARPRIKVARGSSARGPSKTSDEVAKP
jgi:hypothetical protein